MKTKSIEKTYTVIQNMLSKYDLITPCGILDIFQDIAGRHATECNIGFDESMKRGVTWILARTKFDIIKYPPYFDDVVIKSWPHTPRKFDADRDYIIMSSTGEVCIKGSSKWVIVDINNRKLAPLSRLYDASDEFLEDKNYEDDFGALRFDYQNMDFNYETKVTETMLDHNGHMNNSRYAEIIYDALHLSKEQIIIHFEINYHKESKLNESLLVSYRIIDKEYQIVISCDNEIRTVASLLIK